MSSKIIAITLILFTNFISVSQDLSIFTIPSNLKEHANAVIQYDNLSIELVNQGKMVVKREVKINILNRHADYLANLTLGYDKRNKISTVEMEFFNALGKRTEKVRRKDFGDYSATDAGTLYSDNRVLHYSYIPKKYPYTVVYSYELLLHDTAFIPTWLPVSSYNIGLVKSTYAFHYPKTFKISKIESNLDSFNVQSKHSEGVLSYSILNIAPIKKEVLSPNYLKLLPNVRVASNHFKLAGVEGVADNWEEFGVWMYNNLLVTQNNLDVETITIIKEMVKGVEDPIERAKLVYEYMQNKTRYISVQVDVGGWQPMKTDDVDKLGYGDCKALTFYTKALMDAADVPSYYSVVYAGDTKRDVEEDVVSVQGNHVFLCLPTEKDSLWLECTSQKVPFGYRNNFTDDRDVLLVTKEGGKIVHTSAYKQEEHLQKTLASVEINENTDVAIEATIKNYGSHYGEHLHRFDGLSPKDLNDEIKDYLSLINNVKIEDIAVKNNKIEKCYEEQLSFTAENYATKNKDGLLVHLNPFNRYLFVPKRVKNRKSPFEVLRGYKIEDVNNITIPESYQFLDLPDPLVIENQFGFYKLTIEKISEKKIRYDRVFILNKGVYTKELYDDYRKFRKRISKLENIRILINKQ